MFTVWDTVRTSGCENQFAVCVRAFQAPPDLHLACDGRRVNIMAPGPALPNSCHLPGKFFFNIVLVKS